MYLFTSNPIEAIRITPPKCIVPLTSGKGFHALVLVDWHHGSHRAMGLEALGSHGEMI